MIESARMVRALLALGYPANGFSVANIPAPSVADIVWHEDGHTAPQPEQLAVALAGVDEADRNAPRPVTADELVAALKTKGAITDEDIAAVRSERQIERAEIP